MLTAGNTTVDFILFPNLSHVALFINLKKANMSEGLSTKTIIILWLEHTMSSTIVISSLVS